MIIISPTYEGRLMSERHPDSFEYDPGEPLPEYVEEGVDDGAHYIEARPRRDAEGRALIIVECSICGWEAVVTDNEGGDDFITPHEIMEIARRHYKALTKGHKMTLSEISAYGLDRAYFEARGVIVQDWL